MDEERNIQVFHLIVYLSPIRFRWLFVCEKNARQCFGVSKACLYSFFLGGSQNNGVPPNFVIYDSITWCLFGDKHQNLMILGLPIICWTSSFCEFWLWSFSLCDLWKSWRDVLCMITYEIILMCIDHSYLTLLTP